jgi:two-component system chemotaxis response regulator CheY
MENVEKNILIIDSNPAERVHLMMMLNKISRSISTIYEADHGIAAIDVLAKNPVDIIFTDIDMPIMNGREFLNILHNQPKLRGVPVIVITENRDEQLLNMLAFWGHGYIPKPLNAETLETKISNLYGKKDEYYLYG